MTKAITSLRLYFLLALSLLSVGGFALPAQNNTNTQSWYQVEIIIFSQIPYGEKQKEVWPQIPAFAAPTQSISLVPPQLYANLTQSNNSFPLQTNNDFTLVDEATHLSHNPNYQIIGHLAWLQPIISQQKVPTYIQASNNTATFDGLIQLSQKRYIQLNLQAILSVQDSAFSNQFTQLKTLDNNGMVRFLLNRHIRMKKNELNYIDSPFFGILIKVTPHSAPVVNNSYPHLNGASHNL